MRHSSNPYYSAKEAQEKLGLSKAQFHKWVRQGLIPRVVLPGMKQGMYPRRDIDALVFSMSSRDEVVFSSSSLADLMEELNIVHKSFPPAFSLAERIALQQKNRFTFHSLKVHGAVIGFISMFRLPEELLDDLLAERRISIEIMPEHVLPFVRLEPFSIYIDIIAVNPDLSKHLQRLYAGMIIYRFIDLLYHLRENNYQINALYAIAHIPAGERLLKKLGFQQMQGKSLVVDRPAYQYLLDAQGLGHLCGLQEEYNRHLTAPFRQK